MLKLFTSEVAVNAPKPSPLVRHVDRMWRRPMDKSNMLINENYHDELSLSKDHRIVKYASGPKLHGNALKPVIHRLLQHVHDMMTSCKSEYIIWAGTLLGAWRHHGFIPWDTDADVIIESKSLVALLDCLHGNKEHDSIQWIVRHGLDSDIIPIKVVDRNSGYYLDIFACWKNKQAMCLDRMSNPPSEYLITDLFPSRPCLFDHLVVQCPQHPLPILHRYFGDLVIPQKYRNDNVKLFSDIVWSNNINA